MAARGSLRLLQTLRPAVTVQTRGVSSKLSGSKKSVLPYLLGSLAVGAGGYGVYKYRSNGLMKDIQDVVQAEASRIIPSVSAAAPAAPQPSVFSQGKDHALYLWIELTPSANPKEVAKVCATLQKMVDKVTDPSMKDEADEIWAGVGFGPTFFKQVGGKAKQDYTYAYRRGSNGEMPSSDKKSVDPDQLANVEVSLSRSTLFSKEHRELWKNYAEQGKGLGGDVFVHAKCNTPSKLFELAQMFLNRLPAGSVKDFEDIYSFVYMNGRDLSGFIDGTENPADDESRERVAVEKETGGSYVITQKWIHDLKLINSQKDKTMEGWVGRSREDSTEIAKKSISSHVARMTGGVKLDQPKPFEIVRQSMPFGTLKEGAGLFFIGYSASPDNLNYMLDMMVGAGGDPYSDDIMKLSQNVKGTYWYFPGEEQLKKMA